VREVDPISMAWVGGVRGDSRTAGPAGWVGTDDKIISFRRHKLSVRNEFARLLDHPPQDTTPTPSALRGRFATPITRPSIRGDHTAVGTNYRIDALTRRTSLRSRHPAGHFIVGT